MKTLGLCIVVATFLLVPYDLSVYADSSPRCPYKLHHSKPAPAPDIEDSHHDFSNKAWSGGEICKICHTPHNADQTVTAAPLWNHQLSSATYTLYSSSSLNATPGQPTGLSKLCLCCHDGTVALQNHSGTTGSAGKKAIWGNLTTDLSDDHPISFIYNSALATADGELRDPSTAASGLGGTIAQDLLESGSLECTSCHDVHVARNTQGCTGCHALGPGTDAITLSLRVSNTNSAFCLTCHIK